MADILAIVGTAIDTVKKLRAITEKIKDADTRNLIADLNISLADLKTEIATLKEDNNRLQNELNQRDNILNYRENMVVKDNVLYFKEPPAGRNVGPYCPNCFENGKLVVIMDQRNTSFKAISNFRCSECKSNF